MSPAPAEKPAAEKPEHPHAHINIQDDLHPERESGEGSPVLTNSKGWDGKLRVPKSALMTNPEALSDPEYSDDENVLPGEEIAPDEGAALAVANQARIHKRS